MIALRPCVLPMLLAGALALASPAHAALGPTQQSCVNDVNRQGTKVAASQTKASRDCLKQAAAGNRAKLGVPPQAQTAQACLGNDVGGRIARAAARLRQREAARCAGDPPSFGYTSGAAVETAARAAGTGIVAALFGPDLDAAVVADTADREGARCQADVLRYTTDLFAALWKAALPAKRSALRGTGRLTGTGPVESAAQLATEIAAAVQADARGRIARAARKLRDRTPVHCGPADGPLAALFPGECAGETTPAGLASCAERVARRAFFESLAAFDALPLDCDLLDDGLANQSCSSAALREHVLNRLGYGPDPWSRARIETLGVAGYIHEQLAPETIDDGALELALASRFPSLAMGFAELHATYDPNPDPPQLPLADVARELKQAKVLRAVMSRRQLVEVLVDFWLNHFNVAASSSRRTRYDISPYDRLALRPHVLGRFEDLLVATARAPAMLDYLDNRANVAGGINENYAREVLELHTVGVTGPYTEADIPELARCLTGWREDYAAPDGFRFDPGRHDGGAKVVMGVAIPPGGGLDDGLTMFRFLAHHPSTARFVVRKLVVRFVAETPPERLVDEAAGVFLATGGDLRAVLETIFFSPEFLATPEYRHAKVKRPLHFYASLARALGADPLALNLNTIRNRVAQLGEDLYDAGPPTGYPDASAGYWFVPGTALRRFNEADAVSRGSFGYDFAYPPVGTDAVEIVDALAGALFVAPPSPATRAAAIGFLDVLPTTSQTTRVAQTAAVLLSSPEFLTH